MKAFDWALILALTICLLPVFYWLVILFWVVLMLAILFGAPLLCVIFLFHVFVWGKDKKEIEN
jgi:fatty acid desaturase